MADVTVISPSEAVAEVTEYWSPKILGRVNDHDIKVAKFNGDFVWHSHPVDEMFFILSGNLVINLRDKDLFLKPGQFVVIPKEVEHRPQAAEDVTALIIEPKGTVNTGDAQDLGDKKATQGEWL